MKGRRSACRSLVMVIVSPFFHFAKELGQVRLGFIAADGFHRIASKPELV